MIKNTLRHIRNNRLTSFINIFGLGIGLGCVILMGTFILHEFSFDNYHKNSNNLYRIIVDNNASGSYAMGEAFKEKVPGIEKIVRIYDLWNTQVKQGQEYLKEENFILADQDIFSVLDVPLLLGNQNELFTSSTSVAISDQIQNKYFPNENPIGKTLEVSLSGRLVNFTVTGVYKHFPSYSSLQADLIGNIDEAFPVMSNIVDAFGRVSDKDINQLRQNWDKGGFKTLALTSKEININVAEALCSNIYKQHRRKDYVINFQPFNQIYLHSEQISNGSPFLSSQLSTLKIYSGIAALILLIACINYVLLSLADTKKQLKKVACYKINGASSFSIQKKFLLQSIVTSFLSIIPALFFLSLIIPFFNQLFNKNLSISLFLKPTYIALLLSLILFTGLVAGAYISFMASKMNPLQLLAPMSTKKQRNIKGKGLLIATQFIIFIFLFSTTTLMEKQIVFSTHKSPGFNSDNILVFKLNNKEIQNQFSIIKSKIATNPHVLSLAGSSFTPPTESFLQLTVSNGENDELKEEGLFIGPNLISALSIPILDGEDYTDESSLVDRSELILNKTAAEKYNVKAGEYLGKFYIRAIVADFHAHSLHKFIKPLLLINIGNSDATELVIHTDGNNQHVIHNMQQLWTENSPSSYLEYEFLNDRIEKFYTKERKQVQSLIFFTFMAIALAALGLFGYVSLVLIQRTKEIGIRKVNGARISEVMTMLNKDFVKWVVIAFVIAAPVSWYAMHKWLENFAYKTELSWWIFALAGFLALGIALLTVSWQSWRAATRNPVEALRYE